MILDTLPGVFCWNHGISLLTRQLGYPNCYKVDLAIPARKLAIEVDGNSHNMAARKLQDIKKATKLAEFGWSVFRMTNKQVESLFTTSKLREHLITLLAER